MNSRYTRKRLDSTTYKESSFFKNELGFGGSSKFRHDLESNDVVLKNQKPKKSTETDNISDVSGLNSSLSFLNDESIESSENIQYRQKRLRKKGRSVNKKLATQRIWALFSLKASKKTLNFVTISFPLGLSDDIAYIALNTFLTRLRKDYKMKLYVWVAERQKNGTIHYHILIPQFLPVRLTNYKMAKILDHLIIKHNLTTLNFSKLKYNGVDVKEVKGNKKLVAAYVCKYVTKSDAEFDHLAWFCSHSVSALFTNWTTDRDSDIVTVLSDRVGFVNAYSNDFCFTAFLDDLSHSIFIKLLGAANDYVFSKL